MEVTEHRVLKRVCRCCGRTSKGSSPKGECSINYQMFPLERCAEMIEDLSGHRPSTGSMSNFQQQRLALKPFIPKLAE